MSDVTDLYEQTGQVGVECAELSTSVAVLRAALVEAKYRVEQGRVWGGQEYILTGLHPKDQQRVLDVIDNALNGHKL